VLLLAEGLLQSGAVENSRCLQAPAAGSNSEHVGYVSSHRLGAPLRLGCAPRQVGTGSNMGSVGLHGHDRERRLTVEESVG
jgi:hypothetical protein